MAAMTIFSIVAVFIGQAQYFASLSGDGGLSNMETISKQCARLEVSIEFLDEALQIDNAQHKIWSHYQRYLELKEHGGSDINWKTWAGDVLNGNTGTKHALTVLHNLILRDNVFEKYKNKQKLAIDDGVIHRTMGSLLNDFFVSFATHQQMGFFLLFHAYKVRDQHNNMDMLYKIMIERFSSQTNQFQHVMNGLPKCCLMITTDVTDFVEGSFSLVNLQEVESDYRHNEVVTGAEIILNQKGFYNKIAWKIKTGKTKPLGGIKKGSDRQESSDWDYKKYGSFRNWFKNKYVSIDMVQVPAGHVVVGVRFEAPGGYRLSVSVKSAAIDFNTGKIDSSTARWNTGSGHYTRLPGGIVKNGFYDKLANNPSPATWLSGIGFQKMVLRMSLFLRGFIQSRTNPEWSITVKVNDIFVPSSDGFGYCSGSYSNIKQAGDQRCCSGYLFDVGTQQCIHGSPKFKSYD